MLYILGIILNVASALIGVLIPLQLRSVIDRDSYTVAALFLIVGIFILQAAFGALGSYLLKKCGEKVILLYRKESVQQLFSARLSKLVLSLVIMMVTVIFLFVLDW